MDEATELGPQATAAIRDQLDQQVRASVAAGASVATGGEKLDRAGYYYAPTVLTDIPATRACRARRVVRPSRIGVQSKGSH